MAKSKTAAPTASPKKPSRRASAVESKQITPDQIRVRAHEIFEARNGAPGNPVMDWLEAEQELKRELRSDQARS